MSDCETISELRTTISESISQHGDPLLEPLKQANPPEMLQGRTPDRQPSDPKLKNPIQTSGPQDSGFTSSSITLIDLTTRVTWTAKKGPACALPASHVPGLLATLYAPSSSRRDTGEYSFCFRFTKMVLEHFIKKPRPLCPPKIRFLPPPHIRPPISLRHPPKKFKCPDCDFKCVNAAQLAGHSRKHTGERPFDCPHPKCRKSFARKEELTRHVRIHSGHRPYQCCICDKRFGRKDHLNKHMNVHVTRHADPLYQRAICKYFAQLNNGRPETI